MIVDYNEFSPKPIFLKHLIENHDFMNQMLFQYPL